MRKATALDDNGSGTGMSRYLDQVAKSTRDARTSAPPRLDGELKNYFATRKGVVEAAHRHFGQPGLEMAQTAYAKPEHAPILAAISERLADPAFIASMPSHEIAEYQLLTSEPEKFITCVARLTPRSG